MSTSPRFDLRRGVTDPMLLLITRRQVEDMDIESALKSLRPLLANARDAWRYRTQVVLMIDGYDHDPRELVDIEEVRVFLRNLAQQWPYWAYFFNQVDSSIRLLIACTCANHYPGQGSALIEHKRIGEFVQRGFDGMNSIFERFGFPEEELVVISNGVIEALEL